MTSIQCPRCSALIGKCIKCGLLKEIDARGECLDCYISNVK